MYNDVITVDFGIFSLAALLLEGVIFLFSIDVFWSPAQWFSRGEHMGNKCLQFRSHMVVDKTTENR